MNLLLIALTAAGLNFAPLIPTISTPDKEPVPLIIGTPFLHEHQGKLYLCGNVVHSPMATHREKGRFVILLEAGTDWKIYEPSIDPNLPNSRDVWEAWDQTYLEVCESNE